MLKIILSVISVRRLRKKWELKSTRQQKHTIESITESIKAIRKHCPSRGAEAIRKQLRIDYDIRVPRLVQSSVIFAMN